MSYRWNRLVYFARRTDGTGPIKIGCSACPAGRVKQLGFDHADTFELLATAKGNIDTERWLHRRFAAHRAEAPRRDDKDGPIAGATEWFEPVAELLDMIAGVDAGAIDLPARDDRDEAIERRYRAGETLHEIGQSFDLTRERVRQILEAMGVKRRTKVEAARVRQRRYWAARAERSRLAA